MVQVAGPVAGMAGVAALFRPEADPWFTKKRPLLFARGRYERPLSVERCILRCFSGGGVVVRFDEGKYSAVAGLVRAFGSWQRCV